MMLQYSLLENIADVAQLVEHAIGNGEVSGSIPDVGSRFVYPVGDFVK